MNLGLHARSLAMAVGVVSVAVVLPACTRDNPLFGHGSELGGSGDGSASDGTGVSTLSGSATGSGTGQGEAESSITDSGPLDTGEGVCGDGVVDSNEACDDGAANGDHAACHLDCTFNKCGDGLPGPGQLCDDGNAVDDDDCSNDCVPKTCGNGELDPIEECDPSMPGTSPQCTPKCTLNVCHDGVMFGVELCDDGNLDDDDACVDECVPATCGDGHVRLEKEDCDPGAPITAICEDFGYVSGAVQCSDDCNFDASECSSCGNGIVEGGEECDLGKNGVISCGSLGWTGNGDLSCVNNCHISLDPTCCAPVGLECLLADGSLCCSGNCDLETSTCAN